MGKRVPELVVTVGGAPVPEGDGPLAVGGDGLLCEVGGVSFYLEGQGIGGRVVAYPVGELPEGVSEREVLDVCWGVLRRYGVESVVCTGLVGRPKGTDGWVREVVTGGRLVLGEGAQREVRARAERATADFIKEVPGFVRGILSQAVCGVLGLRREFGRVEVDSSGKGSPIGRCIGELVVKEVGVQFEGVALAALREIGADGKYVAAVAKEARDLYRRRLREAVLKEAEELAKRDAASYVEEFRKFRLQSLIPITELEHPGSYAGIIGELVLEDLVERRIGPGLLAGEGFGDGDDGDDEEDLDS